MIEISNVWKSYGATQVLRGINLCAEEGDFIVIRGKSGAGKTTLLKIMGLLEPPDKGEVKIFGKTTNMLSDDEKSKMRLHAISFIYQFFNLMPTLTVLENVELPLALAGINKLERKKRARELLGYFDLVDLAYRFPETLSGGERQRIAIIRALANNPKIILADEPMSSLDDENSQILIKLLSEINRERKVTIIFTTTDLYERVPATKGFVMKEGLLKESTKSLR